MVMEISVESSSSEPFGGSEEMLERQKRWTDAVGGVPRPSRRQAAGKTAGAKAETPWRKGRLTFFKMPRI
jgi:hypothetical protein